GNQPCQTGAFDVTSGSNTAPAVSFNPLRVTSDVERYKTVAAVYSVDSGERLLIYGSNGSIVHSIPFNMFNVAFWKYAVIRPLVASYDGFYAFGAKSDFWKDQDLLHCLTVDENVSCRPVVVDGGRCMLFDEVAVLCDRPQQGDFVLVDTRTGSLRRFAGTGWQERQACRNAPCLFDVSNGTEIVVHDLMP
ncbi:hypothetical protein, partial [Magnetospirillum moscoviense]